MSKKQFIILVIIMIMSSAIISGGALFGGIWYLKNSHSDSGEKSDGFSLPSLSFLNSKTEERPQQPSFLELEKVVLSIQGRRQNHFLMLELAVETRHPERIANINDYMPVVRNSMIRLFSNKSYEDIQQDGAIEKLQNEVKLAILTAFEKTDILHGIDDVFLTKFVVQ